MTIEDKIAEKLKKSATDISLPIPQDDSGATEASWNEITGKTAEHIGKLLYDLESLRTVYNGKVGRLNAFHRNIDAILDNLENDTNPTVVQTGKMEFTESFTEKGEGDAYVDKNILTLPYRGSYQKTISSVELTPSTPSDVYHYRGIGHINGLPDPNSRAFTNRKRVPDRRDPDDRVVMSEDLNDIFNLQSNGIELEEYVLLSDKVWAAEEHFRSQLGAGRGADASGLKITWAMLPSVFEEGSLLSGKFTILFDAPTSINHVRLRQTGVRGSLSTIKRVTAIDDRGTSITLSEVPVKRQTYNLRFPPVKVKSVTFHLEQDTWYIPEFGMGGLREITTGFYYLIQPGALKDDPDNVKFEEVLS